MIYVGTTGANGSISVKDYEGYEGFIILDCNTTTTMDIENATGVILIIPYELGVNNGAQGSYRAGYYTYNDGVITATKKTSGSGTAYIASSNFNIFILLR